MIDYTGKYRRLVFVQYVLVDGANPNGDAITGSPHQLITGHGIITPTSHKHKIRAYADKYGKNAKCIYTAGGNNLSEKIDPTNLTGKKINDFDKVIDDHFDIRAFGCVGFAGDGVAFNHTGPVQISFGQSLTVVNPVEVNISSCINNDTTQKENAKKSVYGGSKEAIFDTVYRFSGSIDLSRTTHALSNADVELLIQSLIYTYEEDMAAARPVGSMQVVGLMVAGIKHGKNAVSSAAICNKVAYDDTGMVLSIPDTWADKIDVFSADMQDITPELVQI